METIVYDKVLRRVDESWQKVQTVCSKNRTSSPCSPDVQDNYDIFKKTLLFERKKLDGVISKNCAKDVKNFKVLSDMKDFDLDMILANATNVEFQTDILQDLHLLASKNNLKTAHEMLEILTQEYTLFLYFKKYPKRNNPRCQTVILFRIIQAIYSTAEARHPVVLPALIVMCDILASEFFFSYTNIIMRLSICNIVLGCVSKTRKFVPEAIQFLKTVLQLALPHKTTCSKHFDLAISEKVSSEVIPALIIYPRDKSLTREGKKIAIISSIADQVLIFATLYEDELMFKYIIEPLLTIFLKLPLQLYPAKVVACVKQVIDLLGRKTPPLRHLQFKALKPKPLKLLEPAFHCKYISIHEYEREISSGNLEKRESVQKSKQQKQLKRLKSVKQRIRKEERCLLREIRKTAKAAAAVKLQGKIDLDKERKRKTNKIISDLAVQEGEFKKMRKK